MKKMCIFDLDGTLINSLPAISHFANMAIAQIGLPPIPVETTLTLIGDKWKVLILRDLLPGTKRFGELKKAYPAITNTMLTNTLRELENIGIVHREQYNEIPPHVEYSLTDKGRELLPVFFEIYKWVKKNLE